MVLRNTSSTQVFLGRVIFDGTTAQRVWLLFIYSDMQCPIDQGERSLIYYRYASIFSVQQTQPVL